MNNEEINKLISDAINSTDGMQKATANPFLLTRINARLAARKESIWANAAAFISRPAVLVPGLLIFILVNVGVVIYNTVETSKSPADQVTAIQPDEFANTFTNLYETDNP